MNTNISLITTSTLNTSSVTTTPTTFDIISNEFINYFETHREKIPLLIIVYVLTVIWIIYLILYNSRIQGILLSYILRRFFFKDATQLKFDSFSISLISGSIMFRNLHYTTHNYSVFIRDGYLVFRYWTQLNKKIAARLKIKLYHVDIQLFSPIRSNTISETNVTSDDSSHKTSSQGISSKTDDTKYVNTTKTNQDLFLFQSLTSLFTAIDIKIEHGRISIGHQTLPYALSLDFHAMQSIFKIESPSKHLSNIDPLTLIFNAKYKNLQMQLYPISVYQEERNDVCPPIPSTTNVESGCFQIFECAEGKFEYEQDIPGKVVEPLEVGKPIPDVFWEIRVECKREAKFAYGPWADRQRALLYEYFLPIIFKDSPITVEPMIGETRIFKSAHFKLLLNCPTTLDLYFMNKTKLQQLHIECPNRGSYIDATFPFSTNPDGFDTFLSVNLSTTIVRTNLSFSPLAEADNCHIKVHIHYPRSWNSLQDWFIDITTRKPQVYFVFQHKNFFQALINDWSSLSLPEIYSFTPYVYHISVRGDHVELLVPCNQGNWIDCSTADGRNIPENNYISLCTKSLLVNLPLAFLDFHPKASTMDITIEADDLLGRLVIPKANRMYYIIEGLDVHKHFHTPDGVKSQLRLSNVFDKREDSFDCGEISHLKILIQILLHSSPPIDPSRTDLLYVQNVRSMGNRQTFHPKKLDYDIFNIEIDIGPLNLLLYGLLLKNLWWVKENLFGWDQMYHDILEPDIEQEKSNLTSNDALIDVTTDRQTFDPRYFRSILLNLRVALHNITAHLIHHTDSDPCPIGFCERLCVELTSNLDETKVQVLFLPINVYVEDKIVRSKSDQNLSTGSLQLSGLVIRGHSMLSHEGLPPERETLEYAWQLEVILGKISARVTSIQMEKLLHYLKSFYLQMMQDEYTLMRSPIMDKTKWIEKLKYNVFRFSLDSVDFALVEVGNAIYAQVAPIRLCTCNMHTSSCNESLTLKVGTIQIRQLLRLHPDSWLEVGSIYLPELRVNAKFDCHPPTQININEQIEFLRRHDQSTQRLHFLYYTKVLQTPVSTLSTAKRASLHGLSANTTPLSCACLGGSPHYYTLVHGEQFFKTSFRLSKQKSFGRSLFRPELHVIHSHRIFQHKYSWNTYSRISTPKEQLHNEEEVIRAFDFYSSEVAAEQPDTNMPKNKSASHTSIHVDAVSRSNSTSNLKHSTSKENQAHKRSSSSVTSPITNTDHSLSSGTQSESYLTPNQYASLSSLRQQDINVKNVLTKNLSTTSISDTQLQTLKHSTSNQENFNSRIKSSNDDDDTSSALSSDSVSLDSLAAFEELLQNQNPECFSTSLPQQNTSFGTDRSNNISLLQPNSSWISIRSQMKMPIPKSPLLCTTYMRYLSHYHSSMWSNVSSFPPPIQQDHISHDPLLDFTCVSQGFSCSFLFDSEPSPSAQSRPQHLQTLYRMRSSLTPTSSSLNLSNVIATEKDICLRFMGPLNILLTPLMLECLIKYVETWKTYDLHPITALDGLQFQAHTSLKFVEPLIDMSATKFSVQLPKINVCLLQAALAEDHVQLSELRTPVDLVTMSLFSLSCKQIQMETILSKRDQSTAGVFKIQSITGQFRRFENNFSSMDHVTIHALNSERCHIQLQVPDNAQTHLPIAADRTNLGFVMNEFGLQRLCFKLINNAAKQQQERKQKEPIMTKINETPTTKTSTKTKHKRKRTTDLPTSSVPTTKSSTIAMMSPQNLSVVSTSLNPLSSSVFDGSIDHVWISFPEPPRHKQATSNVYKQPHTNSTHNIQQNPSQRKPFSYTRYDWNFLSTLSPTVLGWFCVIKRINGPINEAFNKRQQRLDAILAYFLIETTSVLTIPQSKLHHILTPKAKYYLSQPVCQMASEFRKNFNKDMRIGFELRPNMLPEIEILKKGVRESCRTWAQTFKLQTQMFESEDKQLSSSSFTINPVPSKTGQNYQRTLTAVKRDQIHHKHELSVEHGFGKPPRNQTKSDNSTAITSSARKCTGAQKKRPNANDKHTMIEMTTISSTLPEQQRESSFLSQPADYVNLAFEEADTLRRLESTPNARNTSGYKQLNTRVDETDLEQNSDDDVVLNAPSKSEPSKTTTYYTDGTSVEELLRILLEYAGVELSVASSIEPLFEKLGQTVLASALIKKINIKISLNENLLADSQSRMLKLSDEISILLLNSLSIQSVCKQSLEHHQLHLANVQTGIRVQSVKQEFNLSLLRLVYQFYTIVGNAYEYINMDEINIMDGNHSKPDNNISVYSSSKVPDTLDDSTIIKTPRFNRFHTDNMNGNLISSERPCWKKVRELVSIYELSKDTKQIQMLRQTERNPTITSNDDNSEEHESTLSKSLQKENGASNEALLLSGFGWLIINEIHYSVSLGGLRVDGSMKKVQGSVSISQKLRALQNITNYHNSKKYEGSLVLQIMSTSLSLKETLSIAMDTRLHHSTYVSSESFSNMNTTNSTQNIAVLNITVDKSQGLGSLQTRGMNNLRLSAVTNIGIISMDVPLRPQEVHDLFNRAGRLINSYVQEFRPDGTEPISSSLSNVQNDEEPINADLYETSPDHNASTSSRKLLRKPSNILVTRKLPSHLIKEVLKTDTDLLSTSKKPIFEVRITAHCEGMSFSTTLLETLRAQYKIGTVEGVASISTAKSQFTAVLHEHALHFLNDSAIELHRAPVVSSENHVRIDFPQIRGYGNYILERQENNESRANLNIRTNIDVLKLTITAGYLAQLVFVSKVILHEINEILSKVSGLDQSQFRSNEPAKSNDTNLPSSNSVTDPFHDANNDDDSDEQEKMSTTAFIYKINVFMKGFQVMGQTPSNTIVKFENGDTKHPLSILLTNYDEKTSFLLYNKPLINGLLNIKLSLGQLLHNGKFQDAAYFKTQVLFKNSFQIDDPEKTAYVIHLISPSVYWQSRAIDKGILFWLNYKNTYDQWNAQRGAFREAPSSTAHIRSLVNVQASSATANAFNLMFQLHIVNLGIAIPLQNIDRPSIDNPTNLTLNQRQNLATSDETTDFLVFTLDETKISACSCNAIISTGSFEGFCLRFAEKFQHTNSNWKPIPSSESASSSSSSKIIINSCCVPSGQYSMHSRAKHITDSKSPKWFLNIQWDMKGIDISIDSLISKRFTQLTRTITSTQLIENKDQMNDDDNFTKDKNSNSSHNGTINNKLAGKDPNEDDERRKRLEYEYSLLGERIETLKRTYGPPETLKAEEERYQWLEKELLHTVKTEIQQKIKKQSNKQQQVQPPQPEPQQPKQNLSTQEQPKFSKHLNILRTALSRDRNRMYMTSMSVPHHSQLSVDSSPTQLSSTGRRYTVMYASALASSSGADHRRMSEMITRQSSRSMTHEQTDEMTPTPETRKKNPFKTQYNSVSSHDSDNLQWSSTSTLANQNEITSTPAVDLDLNVQILIANGSCILLTRCDLIPHPTVTNNLSKQSKQTTIGAIHTINQIEYQELKFSLPGVDLNAHYKTKHSSKTDNSLSKRASFYCRGMIQSPTTQITVYPVLLNFIEQTLEYVKLPQQKRSSLHEKQASHDDLDDPHLNAMFLMEEKTSPASFPLDVVVSIFIQPCILLFTCLPSHPMQCELRLPAVDVALSSNRTLSNSSSPLIDENITQEILENSFAGLHFSLHMKDFKMNIYHPFSGESKVHMLEDIRSGPLQTRNALAVSIKSVSLNISRARYALVEGDDQYLHCIQLSALAQVSKAQFEYDIRRFSEVLTFPKIWYNRSLARRLFLGADNLPERVPSSTKITQIRSPTATTSRIVRKQARVILAIQLKELDISMRMSNVMGKVEWNTTDVYSTGSLTLTSEGKQMLLFSLGLQNSTFQADQGIIGGMIRMKNLRATGLLNQEFRDRSSLVDASHCMNVLTDAIEIHLDYMGSPTLMGRICHILLRLKDDRPSTSTEKNSHTSAMPPAILVLLSLNWSQLHLMITRSTTPDIIKMSMKLTEFVNAQISNSKAVLASIQYDFRTDLQKKTADKSKQANSSTLQSEKNIDVIKKRIGMNGGEIMLQGHNLTIIIFHGLNFKSRQWAVFSLNEPQIIFVTDKGEQGDINQKLFFYLDHQTQACHSSTKSRANLASVSKVTRNSNDSPPLSTVSEWFNYASGTVLAAGLREFPLMDELEVSTPKSKTRLRPFELSTESIFILPALELSFQTRQLQGQVHCSFETEFYEHIMFTFNAEHFYFLHDLISSYVKEKERIVIVAATEKPRQRSSASSSSTDNQVPPSVDDLKDDDVRKFICPDARWKLQPTIKLLTAFGNEVETFGADYILQKLGFRHARSTIPKWMQRGIMDPCEQSMTFVQLILIFLLPERFKEMCLKSQ